MPTLTKIGDLASGAGLIPLAQELGNLYDQLLDNMEDGEHDRAPGIHASEISGCMRQAFYSLVRTKKVVSISKDWRKRFEVGKSLHDMIQKHFHRLTDRGGLKITFEPEVPCHDTPLGRELFIESHCDGILTFWKHVEGDTWIAILRVALEIKSKSPTEYEKMREPEEKHIRQTTIYQACLDVPLAWYLYWNKGNQNYTEPKGPFLREFDHVLWGQLQHRARYVIQSAEQGVLPDREEAAHCQFCGYSYICQPKTVQLRRPRAAATAPQPITRR